jgi:hypothetical protein
MHLCRLSRRINIAAAAAAAAAPNLLPLSSSVRPSLLVDPAIFSTLLAIYVF